MFPIRCWVDMMDFGCPMWELRIQKALERHKVDLESRPCPGFW